MTIKASQMTSAYFLSLSPKQQEETLHSFLDAAAQSGPNARFYKKKSQELITAAAQHHKGPIESLYQAWVGFLSEPTFFEAHVLCLSGFRKYMPPETDFVMRIGLFERSLYRMNILPGKKYRIDLDESFIILGEKAIRLICEGLLRSRPKEIKAVLQSVQGSPQYQEVQAYLSGLRPKKKINEVTQGQVHNLALLFDEINQRAFNGELERPQLTWSRSVTKRLMGIYNSSDDVIRINRGLDDPRVPTYAVDFVLYHEMLHKALGVKTVNGRHMSHTKEFRAYEKRHPYYEEAKRFLEEFSKYLE